MIRVWLPFLVGALLQTLAHGAVMQSDPPRIKSALGDPWDLLLITVTFSRPVVGALDPFFYYLEDTAGSGEVVSVTNVAYGIFNDSVTLRLDGARNPERRYGLHIVSHTIEDLYGNPLPDPSFASVSIPTVFQNGTLGYHGTQDTELRQPEPDLIHGTNTNVRCDAVPLSQGLLRFDQLLGGGVGQMLPYITIVHSARLRLYTVDRTLTQTPARMLRMLAPWEQAQSTWNSMGNGIDQTNGIETATTDVLVTADIVNQFIEIDVTAAVQAWADGATNYGWAFLPTGTDGWGWASSEFPDVVRRPALLVEHSHYDPICQILQQPKPVTVHAGESFRLDVVSLGSDLRYQWFRDGTAIPGATFSTYSVPSAGLSDNGIYYVLVLNDAVPDACTSTAVRVTVFCDDYPVRLLSAIGNVDQNTITLQFDHVLEAASAQNVSNYTITGGLMVTNANYSGSQITLTTSAARQFGWNYTLTVRNLREFSDCANGLFTNPTSLNLTQDVRILPFDSVWRYHNEGEDLGTAWRRPTYDDATWPQGPGLLGFEDTQSTLAALSNQNLFVRTTLTRTNAGPGRTNITDYFRTLVNMPFDTAGFTYFIRHVVDDGAIFYFNGAEAARFNMPTGEVNFATTAIMAPTEGVVRSITTTTGLVCGINSIAVEVHNQSSVSGDVLFGAEIIARVPFFAVAVCGSGIRLIANGDGTVTLYWYSPMSILQETDRLGGGWTDVREATSPWPVTPVGVSRFYRLRGP